EEVAEFGGGGGGAVGQDDGAQGALVPLLVGDADDGGLGDGGVAHDGVLQVDRGEPLAAGFDDVLGAVHQGQVAVGGDLADVAGAQPPVVELVGVHLGAIGGVVGAGDPRAADLQLAEGLAVVGDDLALVVDQAGPDDGG